MFFVLRTFGKTSGINAFTAGETKKIIYISLASSSKKRLSLFSTPLSRSWRSSNSHSSFATLVLHCKDGKSAPSAWFFCSMPNYTLRNRNFSSCAYIRLFNFSSYTAEKSWLRPTGFTQWQPLSSIRASYSNVLYTSSTQWTGIIRRHINLEYPGRITLFESRVEGQRLGLEIRIQLSHHFY